MHESRNGTGDFEKQEEGAQARNDTLQNKLTQVLMAHHLTIKTVQEPEVALTKVQAMVRDKSTHITIENYYKETLGKLTTKSSNLELELKITNDNLMALKNQPSSG